MERDIEFTAQCTMRQRRELVVALATIISYCRHSPTEPCCAADCGWRGGGRGGPVLSPLTRRCRPVPGGPGPVPPLLGGPLRLSRLACRPVVWRPAAIGAIQSRLVTERSALRRAVGPPGAWHSWPDGPAAPGSRLPHRTEAEPGTQPATIPMSERSIVRS